MFLSIKDKRKRVLEKKSERLRKEKERQIRKKMKEILKDDDYMYIKEMCS